MTPEITSMDLEGIVMDNRANRLWLALLLCAGAAALWLSHDWLRAPYITNDGYQYLDAAASLRSGGCLCTRVVHFDDQVAGGRMPAALTHFPPAYPLLIAGLSRFGLRPETAAYVISAIGFLVCIWLIWDVALTLGGTPRTSSLFVLVWIGNAGTLLYASAILTESLFTAVMMAMVALIVRDLKTDGKHPALLLAIGGLAGAAYSLRYAGLFLIPPAALYGLWRWRRRRETLPWALAGIFAVCVFTIPIQVRNAVSTGTWRGFSLSNAHSTLSEALMLTSAALYHLVLGRVVLMPLEVWTGLLAIAVLSAGVGAYRAWRGGAWAPDSVFLPVALTWVGLCALAYTAGIILASMNTIAQEMDRYYQPVYPILLAGLAGAVSMVRSKRMRSAIAATAVAILAVHGLNFVLRPSLQEHVTMARNLQQEAYPSVSLHDWLLAHVPPGTAITAEEGQALHYVLQRPVVSILEPPDFTDRPTDGPAFYSLMSRYKSGYLLLFPVMRPSQNSLPFLQELISGKLPNWLRLRVRTADVAVYECEDCAR